MKIFIIFCVSLLPTIALTKSFDENWKKRGLEAMDKLKELEKTKNLSALQECNINIEKTFARFATNSIENVSTSPIDSDFNLLFFHFANKRGNIELTVAVSFYKNLDVAAMINPKFSVGEKQTSYSFMVVSKNGLGSFVVKDLDCMYTFNDSNYMTPKVEVNNTRQ